MEPGFKEIAFSDISEVFLDPEEFGERHTVNGRSMVVVIDGMEVVSRSRKQVEHGRIEGIYKKQIILYVSRKEFGPLPAIGQQLKLDGGTYRIMDAVDEGGLYSITLGAVKA